MTPPPATVTRPSVSPRQWPDVSTDIVRAENVSTCKRTGRDKQLHKQPSDSKARQWISLSKAESYYTPCSTFSSHICDDLGDRRDVILQEIASYLVLQKNIVNYHCEAQPTPKKSVDHLQMSYFEEPI
jgi:hypothetical protein